jgi:hypothetical protein
MPSTQGRRHRRDRPLHSSPEPPPRVPAAGRWSRSGRDLPEFVQANPRVPTTPGGTFGTSLVTGGHPCEVRPSDVVTVLEGA